MHCSKGSNTTADACFVECNCTRQRRLCTRQSLCRVLYLVKSCRHIPSRQRLLYRVLFVGHSAKPLPSAGKTLGKDLHSAKWKCEKNPKIIANFFFGGGRHQPAPVRLHRSRCIFCAKFTANAAGGIRTHDLSLACLLLYHCTTLSLFLIYYTKPRVNCLFEALNEFK